MTSIESVRSKLNISPIKADGTQDITVYNYKIDSKQVFNAPKENVDKFVHVLTETKKTSGKILGVSTLTGAIALTTLGCLSKSKKALKASIGLLAGIVSGFASGVFLSSIPGKKNIIKAQTDFLEGNK